LVPQTPYLTQEAWVKVVRYGQFLRPLPPHREAQSREGGEE
jgi:hypothetical protein